MAKIVKLREDGRSGWVGSQTLLADPAARYWLVPDLIPSGDATILSGLPGVGRTSVALALAVDVTSGNRWLDLKASQGAALALSVGETDGDLHRRIYGIRRGLGTRPKNVDGLMVRGMGDGDGALATWMRDEDGNPLRVTTALHDNLDKLAGEMRPALIVLDGFDAMAGPATGDRTKVRELVGLLRALARRHSCGAGDPGHGHSPRSRAGHGRGGYAIGHRGVGRGSADMAAPPRRRERGRMARRGRTNARRVINGPVGQSRAHERARHELIGAAQAAAGEHGLVG